MNEDELKRGLLNKKGTVFDKMYEDCLIKIQRIKQKNDFMQKQVGTELDDNIRGEVKKQSLFLEVRVGLCRNKSARSKTSCRRWKNASRILSHATG